MKVLIDASPITVEKHSRTGLARYAFDLVNGLQKATGGFAVCASGSVQASKEVRKLSAEQNWSFVGNNIPNWIESGNSGIQRAYNLFRTSVTNEAMEYDLFHSTYTRIRKDVRKIFKHRHLMTVHDLTPLKLPAEYFHRGQYGITSRIINSIQSDDFVITVSESTRNDLLEYRQLNPEKVFTVYNGYDVNRFYPEHNQSKAQKVLEKYKVTPEIPYMLTLSALGKHKNIETILEATYLLYKEHKELDFQLVIVGKANDWVQSLLSVYPPDFVIEGIRVTGFIPDEELPSLFSFARGFVFPSIYEGFGLPVIEAMACSSPIIYANNSSLKEICEGVGIPCETMDKLDYARAMKKLLEDEELVEQERIKSIRRAKDFTLEKCIENTISVYRRVIDEGN